MAILAIMHSTDLSRENYESLRPLVNWETNHPAGILFHAAAFDESGGLHVVDVWESAEAMKSFFENRLLPVMQQLNLNPPMPQISPAYNVNAFPGLSAYAVTPMANSAEQ